MPHVMKTIYKFFVLAVAAIGICSCNDEYVSTPQISVSKAIYVSHLDGSRDTTYFGDTLRVGDTARVEMCVMGVSHPLVYAQVKSEPSALNCAFECDSSIIKDFLEPDSRLEEGYIHFQPNVMYLWVVYRYIAKSVGDYTMTFVVESMAKEPYSHAEGDVKQVIR